MGFGDKLKGLKDQAQQAVADNKDKIQDAVQVAGQVANTKTHGKYATRIAKVGEKLETGVDKFAEGEGEDVATAAPAAQEPAGTTQAPAAQPSSEPPAFESHAEPSESPAFEPHAEEPPAAPAQAPTHSAPDFE
jgi:gas vesicle protein